MVLRVCCRHGYYNITWNNISIKLKEIVSTILPIAVNFDHIILSGQIIYKIIHNCILVSSHLLSTVDHIILPGPNSYKMIQNYTIAPSDLLSTLIIQYYMVKMCLSNYTNLHHCSFRSAVNFDHIILY